MEAALATDWPSWHCPAHGLELVQRGEELACPRGHAYPVVAQIPRFAGGSAYTDAFGAQWLRYRQTQLDSFVGAPISRDRARRAMGTDLFDDLAGRHVLECGCGAGRFTEVLLEQGALVTSVDLSAAVEANRENFPGDGHRVAQADLLEVPFAPRRFDVVFCLGVVQHTPDSEIAIARLYEHVAPGGTLVLDHYAYTASWLSWYLSARPFYRRRLRRLSPEEGLRETERLVDRFLPLHRRTGTVARAFVSRVSPVMAYYTTLPELSEQSQREWALLDTHDSLTDWHKRFRTPAQIRATLEALGLGDVVVGRQGVVVEARGRRPAATSPG